VLILRDFATILLPVTYDLAPQQSFGDLQFSPYLGGGIAINTGSNSSVGPMLTAGLDIPLSSRFTINVAANLAFLRTTDLGILVGIGYNF
jgi:outer membrane protein W